VSSHGHLDEFAPFASSLVLAGRDELTVADIAGLRIRTDLAVLTGCDTGRGDATLGGDVVGLTRALLRSGVRRAVVSLWPVDDDVAPVVMAEFYARISRRVPPAQALAEAERVVYAMSASGLQEAYVALGGHAAGSTRRRGIDLDPELRDNEEIPEMLGGNAERYWAPFVVFG
jgi:CHAT domain-containing protein